MALEAAAGLARLALAARGAHSDAERITHLFQRGLARAPEAEELQQLADALATHRALYQEDQAALEALATLPPAEGIAREEYAAWIATVRLFLNAEAFITRG